MASSNEEEVRAGVRKVYRSDRSWGRIRPIARYHAMFPGHETVVADEFERLRKLEAGARQIGGTPASHPSPPLGVPMPAAEPRDEAAGDLIGPYRVLEELGRGGQATVYLAEDTRLSRKVALKVLPRSYDPSGKMLKRFQREAEITGGLDHPGICVVYEAGEADGTAFIAMRYVKGETIRARLDRATGEVPDLKLATSPGVLAEDGRTTGAGETADRSESRLTPPSTRDDIAGICALIEKTARALHVAHEAGLIHRDIKPGNVMVTGPMEPVILDFGLAREEESGAHDLTMSGTLMGTPAYMSPEQLMAQRVALDRRTDIYSLGVTLYECLTLRLPFEGPTREVLYQRILASRPDDPRRVNRAISADLKVVLDTAMEKDRDRRYQTALDLAEELRRVREDRPIEAKPVGVLVRLYRWGRRNPALAGSGVSLFVALVAGLTVSLNLLAQRTVALSDAKAARQESERSRRDSELAHQATREALVAKEETLRKNRALGLAAASAAAEGEDPMRALLLAREAGRTELLPAVVTQLRSALLRSHERVLLDAHEGPVSVAAYSPSGEMVLTTGNDGTARVWDAQGEELAVLRGHEGAVYDGAWSPRETLVVTASEDGTARLWDLRGRQRAKLSGHEGVVGGAQFASGGERIVTVGNDGTARIWDLDGNELAVMSGHGEAVWGLAISAGGDRIATVGSDHRARIWDLDGKEQAVVGGPGRSMTQLCFSPSGDHIATAGEGAVAHVWTVDGKHVAALEGHGSMVACVAFSGDGKRVATGSGDASAIVWDLSGKRISHYLGHLGTVNSVVFSRAGNQVLTSSDDGTVRVWNASGVAAAVMRGHREAVRRAQFSPSGDRVLSVSRDGTARVWDLSGRAPVGDDVAALRGHAFALTSASFSPDGAKILTTSMDGTARLWDRSGKALAVLRGHKTWILSGVFSADGERVLTAAGNITAQDRRGTARLWDLEGNELARFEGHEKGVTAAIFTPDGKNVLTTSYDGTVRIWDLDGKERSVVLRAEREVSGVAFVPDRPVVVLTFSNGVVALYDIDTRQWVQHLQSHTGTPFRPVFSPAGDLRFLTASLDKTARLYDLDAGDFVEFKGHDHWVTSTAFSPDGSQVLTASADGTIRLWDTEGNVISVMSVHPVGGVASAAFSPSGDRILTASGDFTARLWLVRGEDLLAVAEQRIHRDFSLDERKRYAGLLGPENASILRAHRYVKDMAKDVLLPSAVADRVRSDPAISEEFRSHALALVSELRAPSPAALNERSWWIVVAPDRDPADYARALAMAEEAARLAPASMPILNTLGVARYRAGKYDGATSALTRSDTANTAGGRPGQPSDLAFLAMAQHHLGNASGAARHLERLRKLMTIDAFAKDPESRGFLREAEDLIEPDAKR